MPKGDKLRPKQMDQLPLENFKKSRVGLLICQNTLIVKIWSLAGRIYDYGKKGEFLDLDHFHSWIISLNAQTSEFDLEIGKRIYLQKQTKWWQRTIQICQILSNTICVLNCIDIAFLFVAF
jgi:hypothetical protein